MNPFLRLRLIKKIKYLRLMKRIINENKVDTSWGLKSYSINGKFFGDIDIIKQIYIREFKKLKGLYAR